MSSWWRIAARTAAVTAAAVVANIPMGRQRADCEKFSPSWFFWVHASVPAIVAMRRALQLPRAAIVLTVSGAIAGQAVGARREFWDGVHTMLGVAPDKDIDVFRDTPVRLLGYTNEIGEAFRRLVSARVVWSTYGVALAYVGADVVHKVQLEEDRSLAWRAGIDAASFQLLASILIPGMVINRVCAGAAGALRLAGVGPGLIASAAPTAIGLAAIPAIVEPIDKAVHWALDETLRRDQE